MHQNCALNDTIYFGFAANLTSGAAGDGATPLFDVRLCGAASSAAPVYSGTPTLLTDAGYTDGLHEIAIPVTAGNGFAAGSRYLVFCTLTISSVTPAACVGGFSVLPVLSNMTQILGTAVSTPATAGILDVNVKNIDNDAASASGTVTFPNATLASTTNITAGTVTTATNVTTVNGLAANVITAASIAAAALNGKGDWNIGKTGYSLTATTGLGNQTSNITGTITTVTNLTNLPAITAGWLTAAGIAAGALNGKGDWNIGKTGYSLTVGTGLGNQTADITGNLSGSVGSVTGAVGSVTGNIGGNVTGSVGSIAAGGITAASIATGAVDADALAADAVTEIQAGLSTLTEAGVRTAVGLASANLDTQLAAIDDAIDTEVGAIKTQTDKLTFTVANQVDANIKSVTGITVTGAGTAGDPWGP